MLYEPSVLASAVRLVSTCLREYYGIDPTSVYADAQVPIRPPESPRARLPLYDMQRLWACAIEASGDPAIGLRTGAYATPTIFYAFGYSWLASETLLDGLQRLVRYHKVVSTASVDMHLSETDDTYVLSTRFPVPKYAPPRPGIDCGLTALLAICKVVAEKRIVPVRVDLTCPPNAYPDAYREALYGAALRFGTEVGAVHFDKRPLLARLPVGAPDIAEAADEIAEQYVDSLDPRDVASQVRRQLVSMLPAGRADQHEVARRLNCSTSTLQRRLKAEGISYRDVLESTRCSLAEQYLVDGKYTQSQIAYLLGFSDQSSFSRAFKRWTAMSPRDYRQ